MKIIPICDVVPVKSLLSVIRSRTFLDLIFPMQVSLGNKESYGNLQFDFFN